MHNLIKRNDLDLWRILSIVVVYIYKREGIHLLQKHSSSNDLDKFWMFWYSFLESNYFRSAISYASNLKAKRIHFFARQTFT